MESTNELVTKAEANAEGLSIESTNECITKAEFNANLPTPPQFSLNYDSNNKTEIVYIMNSSNEYKTINAGGSNYDITPKGALVLSFSPKTSILVKGITYSKFIMNYIQLYGSTAIKYINNMVHDTSSNMFQCSSSYDYVLATIYITE